MKKKIIAVDLFCGAGGLTRGLLDTGIKVKKGFDNDPALKKTYESNNFGVKFYCKDIAMLRKKELLKDLDIGDNYFLLAGCAPCQPFSNINRTNKTRDQRKNLLMQFGRLVRQTLPDFVFIENVPGLKSGRGKRIFHKFENILKDNGYHYVS